MRVVFVHGACVKDGSWWWHRTAELLDERGVSSVAPALPSCGETGEPTSAAGPGLAEDVAAVRDVLTASDEPTIVVAHSYGGIVTAEAAAGVEAVRHLLLVSSYLPEVGQSLSSFGSDGPAPFLDIDPDVGTFTVRPESLAETFLQDCEPEIQRRAMEMTARQSLAVLNAARAGNGLEAGVHDVRRLRAGPGHPRGVATRVRPKGRQRRRTGLGPPPVSVSACRHTRSCFKPGAACRNRTDDLVITSESLYQLS